MKRHLWVFLRDYHHEILICFVFLIALVFRTYTDTYHLLMVPDYDGYQYVKIAKNMAKGVMVDEAVNWTPLLPALIAIFSFLPIPLDQIGSFINIFFGSLTVLPIYLFVRNILNKESALFSILIYAFHPEIAFVNVQVMSETTYIFMIFMFSWLVSVVMKGEKYTIKHGILSGIFGGLIYLGRPEGTLIFITLSILCLFVTKVSIYNKMKWFIVNFIVFFIIIFPYLLFLRNKIGKFVFSGKSKELVPLIRKTIAIPDSAQSYFQVFTYDVSKTLNFIKNNLVSAWFLITDHSLLYALIFLFLVIMFILIVRKSLLGLWKSIFYFSFLLSPVSASLIFKVDHRYLSPTISVLAVICGIGLYGAYTLLLKKINTPKFTIAFLFLMIILFSCWGFYKVYHRFEKEGELREMFSQERLYKKTGLWLKEHVPANSKIVSVSTNYLIAYYAGDLPFKNVSKSLTEDELIEMVCSEKNTYLVINDYAISRYYKNLRYLLNPYSQAFKTSLLYDKIINVYYDDIAMVAVYSCKSHNVK